MLFDFCQVRGSDHCPGESFSHAHRAVILARCSLNSFPVCSVLRNTGFSSGMDLFLSAAKERQKWRFLKYLHSCPCCLCSWTVNENGHAMKTFGAGRAAKYLHLLRKAQAISVQVLWVPRGLWKPSRRSRASCLMLTWSQRESAVNCSLCTLPCLAA